MAYQGEEVMADQAKTGIIVIGANGRMGRTITGLIADESPFKLVGAVDSREFLPALAHLGCLLADRLEDIPIASRDSVAIDFSTPRASMRNAAAAAARGLPMVIGTTGFDVAQKEELASLAAKTPLLWSANMSIGVHVLLRFLPLLAEALGPRYDMEMVEIHHRRKKDAPSGTALMLGEALAQARGWKLEETRDSCRDGLIGKRPDRQIGIQALRGGDVVGIHTCYFLGPGETIEITHQAESRENFAQGALRAAAWLAGQKPGHLYSMGDVIASTVAGEN